MVFDYQSNFSLHTIPHFHPKNQDVCRGSQKKVCNWASSTRLLSPDCIACMNFTHPCQTIINILHLCMSFPCVPQRLQFLSNDLSILSYLQLNCNDRHFSYRGATYLINPNTRCQLACFCFCYYITARKSNRSCKPRVIQSGFLSSFPTERQTSHRERAKHSY